MKLFVLIALLFQSTFSLAANAPKTQLWQEVLDAAVSNNGEVDYVWIDKNQGKLKKFIFSFKNVDPTKWSENTRKANYINLYNASMIYNLLRYAKESKIKVSSNAFLDLIINKISVSGGNIWNGNYKVPFAGTELNLDEIEHGLVRGKMIPNHKKWFVKN